MKKICFFPINETALHEMLPIYEALKKIKECHPVVIIADHALLKSATVRGVIPEDLVYMCESCQREIENQGRSRPNEKGFEESSSGIRHLLSGILMRAYSYIPEFGPALNCATRACSADLSRKYIIVKELVKRLSPETMVVSGDRHLGYEPALLKACREGKVRTIVPAMSFTGNKDDLTFPRSGRMYRADLHPEVAKTYPKQVVFDARTKHSVFFYPVHVLQALAQNDMLAEDPWVMGGGHSVLILADGEETKERYISLGCNAHKITVTGHASHDKLKEGYERREELKPELIRKYSLDATKKLIVMALPQLAEHGMMGWDKHREEIGFLMRTLLEVEANCLISLHPKMVPAKYRFIEAEYGIPTSTERLVDILPAADVFAATYSSTVQWAVLCQIPTVLFDFYGFNYPMYGFLKGVKVVTDKMVFAPYLRRLLLDREYYLEMSMEQKKMAARISPFDGRCMERILDVVLRDRSLGGTNKEGSGAHEQIVKFS
jgi:hypothetical protein